MTPHRIAAGIAGLVLAGVLAACSGTPASTSSSGIAPVTSGQSSSLPAMTVPTGPPTADAITGITDPTSSAVAGATGSDATGTGASGTARTGTTATGGTRTAGTAKTAPQPAPNYAALAQQFVTLRDSGTAALATVKGQASSTDLNADKQLMTYAANVFANYYSKLNLMPFPAQLKADQQTLLKTIGACYTTMVQASKVQTFDQFDALLQTLVNERDDQLNATDQVEKDLGLPQSTPPPGS